MGTKHIFDIDSLSSFETMPKNDLHINENRWRHRCLFRKRHARTMLRLGVVLLVIAAFATPCWWLGIPPFGLTIKGGT